MENTYRAFANKKKTGVTTDSQVKKTNPNCSTQEDQLHNNKQFKQQMAQFTRKRIKI